METWCVNVHHRRRCHHGSQRQQAHHRGQTAKHPANQNLHFGMGAAGFIFGQNRNKGLGKCPFSKQSPEKVRDTKGHHKGIEILSRTKHI